jgi:hypothetical protein
MYIVVVFTVLDGPVLCDPHELEEATDMSSEGDERLHLSCKGSERGSKLVFVLFGMVVGIADGGMKRVFALSFCSLKDV